eukprot:6689250-Pyramimonas_sp.AAC.1
MAGVAVLSDSQFEKRAFSIIERADDFIQQVQRKSEQDWKCWIGKAFLNGAGQAHKASKTKALAASIECTT